MTDQLDLGKTYSAILNAAKERRCISYGTLAKANNAEWTKVRYKISQHLGDLMKVAVENGWPILSAIVVNQDNIKTRKLDGTARNGFINAAKYLGFDVSDSEHFIKEQQEAVFAWAETAPGELITSSENAVSDLFDDENRRFWFVGAMWGEEDHTERFCNEGIWQNGKKQAKYTEHVARMQPGDRIAIKSDFFQTYNLPFDNQGQKIRVMDIKAIGTITEVTTDGWTVKVDWQQFDEPRKWYFYAYSNTITEAKVSNECARRLIQFTFDGHRQDYGYWLPRYVPETNIEQETNPDPDETKISPYGITDILEDGCFLPQKSLDLALSRLKKKLNLILQGPPGTGKTWLAKRLGYALIRTKDRAVVRKRMRFIQFHPSLSYEDFIRGWRPDGDGQLSLIDGAFLEAVEAARAEPDPFVVIIEEINRGNPAQIFGEMLTLLENDKRKEEEAIELAYRREHGVRVFIPHNLFVIGTMNIADRSLALVDLALRRRFAFVTLETALNESWLKWCTEQAGITEDVLIEIRQRMTKLNDEITADRSLGAQFKIGHSYVTPASGEQIKDARAWFREIVETEIEPLLEEYWFDNLDKARASKTQLLQGL